MSAQGFISFYTRASFYLYPLSISLLRNLSQLSWNSLFVEQMRRKSKSFVNGMLRFKTKGPPIYDLNQAVDRILSCRA